MRPSKSTKDMELKSLKKNTRAKALPPAVQEKSLSGSGTAWIGT